MKTKTLVLLAIVALGNPAWAAQPQAVLTQIKGKVEIKAPGTSSWAPATEGQVLSPSATLSTGFDSSVVVVMEKNTLQVKPLTRITIDKLVEESGVVKTSTFLRVGSVSASVKSAEGVKQEFKVQSPYSTASVRGTEFDYDGLKLKVREGIVALILGRPQREVQPVAVAAEEETPKESAPGGETPPADAPADQAADPEQPARPEPTAAEDPDFVGAPEAAGTGEAVPVTKGQEAKIEIDHRDPGSTKTSSSADQDQRVAPPTTPTTPPKVITTGGLTLTITFAQ